MPAPAPRLIYSAVPPDPKGVVLVLHGGREHSRQPVRSSQIAVLRMLGFANRLRSLSNGELVIARLHYAVRGWNNDDPDADAAPVADAHWALAQLADRFPTLPVGLLGHSMGGRTALRAAGAPAVTTVVAVAPWLLPGEPTEQLTGCDVLLVHGTADRMTSPRASAAMAARLRWDGIRCSYIELVGEKHAMLRRARLWHELAAGFLVEALLTDSTGDTATQSMSDPAPNLLRRVSLGEDWITA